MSTIKQLRNKMAGMANSRSNYETAWRGVAKLFLPSRMAIMSNVEGGFFHRNYAQILNSTHISALDTFVSAMVMSVTNPNKKWIKVGDIDPEYANRSDVSKYLNELTDWTNTGLLRKTNFYRCAPTAYQDLAVFGCSAIIAEPIYDSESFINFTQLTPSTFYVDCDQYGKPETFGRKFSLPITQILDIFCRKTGEPDLSNLGPSMKLAAEKYLRDGSGGDASIILICCEITV